MTFVAVFAPMIFDASPQPEKNLAYVGHTSPVVADRMDDDVFAPMLESKPLGMGGPIDALINPQADLEEPIKVTAKPRVIVQRVNKLNYSNAIFPVFPAEVSSEFGWRTPPCDECSADHKGTDFVPGRGAEVWAVLDGLVVEAGVLGGYGTWVKLEHRVPSIDAPGEYEVWETVYAHLQTNSIPSEVGIGSVVRKGDVLGLVGNTGTSTGDHLHFEIQVNGEHQDPFPLLSTYVWIEKMPDGSEEFVRYE